ncbi:NEW3 domain-containing protein [Gracilibacillus sp. YIM 98692]|uniref:COG1470 family protein n=1 Tax=Gracilibacillus sp. YIM 98692 TaxID=2663532 RepID=UPI0013D3D7F1|nr:NEW3 domain-containing protein [Gracilibacillus sp. YIM 98692]
MFRKFTSLTLTLLLLVSFFFTGNGVKAAGGLTLFTPYSGLSVTPGETLTYDVTVINSNSSINNVTFDVEGLPEGWDYTISASGNDIRQLSIRENSEENIRFEINVPLEVEKADYSFQLIADGSGNAYAELPFLTTVSEEGTFQSELSVEQANLEGHADATFSYSATLRNRTADQQTYALSAGAQEGWGVQFKADGNNVTSVTIEPGATKDISIDLTPPNNIQADTYSIPIQASTNSTSAEANLEAVITGSYGVSISTPEGNLSTDITAGKERTVDLVVENTGTATLNDISISASTPPNWNAEFDSNSLATLEAGDSKMVKATLTAPDDAIAGDYVTTFTAETAEASSDANFRVSVETSTWWGIIGIVIILIVIGGLYYIFRTYGRR